jgi:16S rRNA (cytidine1402-2'-O)-methyltransferase
MSDSASGTLFIVATPIGNLEDVTLRALRILRSVDLVAAEDTRHSAKLLTHYDIRTPTTSLHEHNEHAKVPALVARLLAGSSIALVSDAGTPAVSDPGYRLAEAAIAAGVRVEAIPGPSAVLAALVASGLPLDGFVFAGFAPARSAARRAWFAALASERRSIVFFEAPHRVVASLGDAGRTLGDRRVAVGRELTKLHETWVRGPISEVLTLLGEPRGEFTIVLEGARVDTAAVHPQVTDQQVLADFCRMTEAGAGRREALAAVAKLHGMRSRDVFAAIDRARES